MIVELSVEHEDIRKIICVLKIRRRMNNARDYTFDTDRRLAKLLLNRRS